MIRRANAALDLVRRAFEWGADFGLVAENPAKGVRRNRVKPRHRWFDDAECKRFLEALPYAERELVHLANRPEVARVARSSISGLRLIYLTGARRSEIFGLRRSELALDSRELRLADSKSGPRVVPLSDEACDEMRAHLSRVPTTDLVFEATKPGRPIEYMTNVWARVLRMADLGKPVNGEVACIHTLRHTWACQALLAGVPIHEVSRALGHSSVSVTEHHYAHVLMTDSTRRSAASVGARLASFGKRAA